MKYFAIRQISTGHYMPNYGTRKGRGGWTNDEPQPADKAPPRLFIKRQYAKAALREWLKGVQYESYTARRTSWGDHDCDVELLVRPKPERAMADDMEIVELLLGPPEMRKSLMLSREIS